MNYQPSLPEHNDNVSHQHPLREFLFLLAGLAACALAVFWALGLAVDVVADHVSPEIETQINRAVSLRLVAKESFAPRQEAMLQALTDELKQCAGVSQPIQIHMRQATEANAAALPGGHVIVHSGLLDKVASRNGLAFVLAHELAHFKHRDHLRALGRNVLLIALSAALSGAHSDVTQLLVPVNLAGYAQYSQQREEAADREALRTVACLFGHAGGATEFLEAMRATEDRSSTPAHYFASHPRTELRITALNSAIRDLRLPVKPAQPLDKGQ
ncbi:MAG TPA: M48 family metallopeptidase [Paucimonas sp.]|nr:M48 family metallopeptidase [Paucimonas sp.]